MSFADSEKLSFLHELYNQTKGDFEAQVSMHDVGQVLGLEEDGVAQMTQDLFIEGLAEMKTLSGGIGITVKGLEALDIKVAPEHNKNAFVLGSDPVLDDQAKEAVENMLREIKSGIENSDLSFDVLEELVIDMKTIEVQLLSPNPKTSIIRELFKSILPNISFSDEIKIKLETMAA